ncbi:unnamed protein product [Caenorhabditis angaria]|uniref:Uncharacterized protein n=1 Tax=Caenorhabditis angaria TaxID=860376 RepID=A0A9P1I429_9PELO|nr:unnamed protein product [Caenorhabditis angaria]
MSKLTIGVESSRKKPFDSTRCKKGSIVPLIVANKIWINGHFETEENGLVAWWISQFRPGIYGIQISAKQEMVHIKHLEHLRRAAVLHVKGHTDVDETTILEFRGTCLRIDDWSKPNYDGMTLLSVLENYIEDGEKQDLIINNKWIDYEFWKPVEEFLRLLVDDFEFDSDEHRLFFSYHFRRFQLIVECLPGHFSVQILVPS